ncbi:MAG: acyl-CoA thioesterase [Planctomycetota bacterium]|jgi:acyl-CoA thioester hydrolase
MTPSVTEYEARSYELDPYGHLNNSVIVNWLEHGRLGFLRDRGESYTSLPDKHGVWIVVVRQEIDYRAQINLGDRLVVTSTIEHFGKSSFRFDQQVAFPDGRTAAAGKVIMVCIDKDDKPVEMPEAVRRTLSA